MLLLVVVCSVLLVVWSHVCFWSFRCSSLFVACCLWFVVRSPLLLVGVVFVGCVLLLVVVCCCLLLYGVGVRCCACVGYFGVRCLLLFVVCCALICVVYRCPLFVVVCCVLIVV